MSSEPGARWTVDSLHEHLRSLIDERDRRYEQRFEAQEEAVANRDKANEKRLDSVNEFRGQLSDVLANTMPRSEAEAAIHRNAERVSDLAERFTEAIATVNSRLDVTQGSKQGGIETKAAFYALVGFIVSLIVIGAFVAAAWPK